MMSNKTVLDEKEAFLELDSSFFTCTQGSKKGGYTLDFKELKWTFPAIEDRGFGSRTCVNPREVFLKEQVKVDSRNGMNCLESFGKHRIIYGDMDGNIAQINLRKALNSPGKAVSPEIMFRKIFVSPVFLILRHPTSI